MKNPVLFLTALSAVLIIFGTIIYFLASKPFSWSIGIGLLVISALAVFRTVEVFLDEVL